MIAVIGKFLVAVLISAFVMAETDPPIASQLPTFAPRQRVTIGNRDAIIESRFSPDSCTLHVFVRTGVLNVWRVAVYYWPELVGGLSCVTLALGVWAARRIWRRRQVRGLPYCRSCNYCLVGLPSARCPECGKSKRPIAGRPRWMRSSLPLSASLLLPIGWLALWIAGVPRDNSARNWFHWPILRASAPGFIIQRIAGDEALVEISIDVANGHATRRILRVGSLVSLERITPDGNGLVWREHSKDSESLRVTGLRTGETRSSLKTTSPRIVDINDTIAYVAEREAGLTRLVEWNFETGAARTIITTVRGPKNPNASDFIRLPGPLRFFERIPTGATFGPAAVCRLHEIVDGGRVSTVELNDGYWPEAILGGDDPNTLYMLKRNHVVEADLHSGRRLDWSNAPDAREIFWSSQIHAASRLLVTVGERNSSYWVPPGKARARFIAFDLDLHAPIALFEHSVATPFGSGSVMAISPDGRWLATHTCDWENKARDYTLSEIVVFDLGSIPRTTTVPRKPAPGPQVTEN